MSQVVQTLPGTVLTLHLGFNNVYAIITEDGLILIDAGPDFEGAWEMLAEQIKAHGFAPADVRAVLITHSHLDHSGLASRWQEEGAMVMAARGEERALSMSPENMEAMFGNMVRFLRENGVPESTLAAMQHRYGYPRPASEHDSGRHHRHEERRRWRPPFRMGQHQQRWHGPLRMNPVVPNRLLEDGEEVTVGSVSVQTIVCPGHTPANTVYYYPQGNALFTGDHILPRTTPNPGLHFLDGTYESRMKSLPAYVRSLYKVRDLPVQRLLPGHQWETNDLKAAVDRLLRHHRQRAARILQILKRQPRTAYDIVPTLWPHLHETQMFMALVEVVGHLDLLEEEGRIAPELTAGRGNVYHVKS